MRRFYRGLFIAGLVARAGAAGLHAQTVAERPPLGATITVDALATFPAGPNLFSLLDAAVPDVIADRVETGGLSAADPTRIGAHGSSWTQTLFRVGDVDITDPAGTGTPLIVPGVEAWQRVDVATGLMPIDVNAPGLAITLVPRDGFTLKSQSVELSGSVPGLNAGVAATPPSIARLNSWLHADAVLGGRVAPGTVAWFLTTSLVRSTQFERSSPIKIDANFASAFVTVGSTPNPGEEVRVVAWLQRARDPVANHFALGQPNAGEVDILSHAQVGWSRVLATRGASVRVFGAFTARGRNNELHSRDFVAVERLRDGPVPNLLDAGVGTDRIWTFGGRAQTSVAPAGGGRHEIVAGAEVGGSDTGFQSTFTGRVGELVDGLPARIWEFADPITPSKWRNRTSTAFVGDTIAVAPRLTVNAGLRLETLSASRVGAGRTAVSWHTLLPRAGVHVGLTEFWKLASFAQYGQYAHRLPLTNLAYGDPTAPTASVYRWTAPAGTTTLEPGALGPLVQRLGPGSGDDPEFSRIDRALRRPRMSEFIVGFEARPHPSAFVRLAAIGRRERNLIGVVDTAVPESSYSTIGVPDPGIDLIGTADDQILLFYNRSPATFGADRYLLTNPAGDEGSFVGADFTGQVRAARFMLLAGATAGRSEGLSASRGFGAIENDAAVLGEVYLNPNARAHAQGRLFTERGYTLRFATAYQFPRGYHLGVLARYQDGQHFARMVILPDLNQGAEAVRAFRNGRTRFTFSMTVDARLQKSWTVGSQKIVTFADAYNLFNQALEVEEFSVTGATSRLTSAVQPPRALQVGVRVPF